MYDLVVVVVVADMAIMQCRRRRRRGDKRRVCEIGGARGARARALGHEKDREEGKTNKRTNYCHHQQQPAGSHLCVSNDGVVAAAAVCRVVVVSYTAGALLVGARPRYASILSILPGQQNRV